MSISRTRNLFLILGCLGAFSAVAWLVGCGSSTKSSSMGGTVTTSLSDPPICSTTSAPAGPFSAVWVTVTKVTANINSGAGPNDSGWQTLIDLTSNPMQVNLFSATSECFLTQLGSTSGLPAGDYQQIRIFLLDNSSSTGPATNNCGTGNGWNCVVDGNGPHELQLSSEAQTGLKIPSGQIAGGKFTITAGQSSDLDIDFNACESVVAEGNGQFRLKPVLHAGEVALNQNTIGGTVVDSATGTGIMGATVLLEQPSPVTGITDPVDQIIYSATTDSNGNFLFCPVQGTPGSTLYDVVITAQAGGATYNPDIVFSVPVGTAIGNIKMLSEGAASIGGTLQGQITSAGTSGAIAEDVALQAFTKATPSGGMETEVTIPAISTNSTLTVSQPQNFMTQATANVVVPPAACPAGTDCFNYQLTLPASSAQVSTFPTLPAPTTPTLTINYDLLGTASGCTASTPSPAFVTGQAVTPSLTPTVVGTVLAFTGCT